jgi:hypothetical protein
MRTLAIAFIVLSMAVAGCGDSGGSGKTEVLKHSPVVDKTIDRTKEKKAAQEEKAEPAVDEETPGEAPAKPE